MSYRVFVSHAGKDRAWVEWIKGQTGPGVELWLAEHDVQPGTPVANKVQKELDACQAVFVFITEASQASTYVQQEIGWAMKAKKPIIPLVQKDLVGVDLAMLQGAEYIPLDFLHPDEGRAALLHHLQTLAQAKAASDQLQTALLLVGALVVVGILLQQGS
jgi:hypothetical protein